MNKNIIVKLFILGLMTVSLNVNAQTEEPMPSNKVTAVGDDPNAAKPYEEGSDKTGSGIMITGFKADENVCVKCQQRNKLKLTDVKDNAQPGASGGSSPASSGSGSGNSNSNR